MAPAFKREHGESGDLECLFNPGPEMPSYQDQPLGYRNRDESCGHEGPLRPQLPGDDPDHAGGDQPQYEKRAAARQVRGPPAASVLGKSGPARTAPKTSRQGEPTLLGRRGSQLHARPSFRRSWRRRRIAAAVRAIARTSTAPSTERSVISAITRLMPTAP